MGAPDRSDTRVYKMIMLELKTISEWRISYLKNVNRHLIMQEEILGEIINAVGNKDKLKKWKQKIAHHIFINRIKKHDPKYQYAISISMRFCGELHGNMKLDIDNYLKPIYDGLAAGLFCKDDTNPPMFDDFQYDDSNFNKLYIERVPDALTTDKEGVYISASIY